MDERDVLREAAKILMDEGWGQGSLHWEKPGLRCVLGALDAVNASTELIESAEHRLIKFLSDGGNGYFSLIRWNDNPHRTVEDVILALKRAAK